jgi:hypothetical protein
VVVLALRPEFSAQARMPATARCVPRGGRRGVLVLTAGLGAPLLPAIRHRLGGFVPTSDRSGFSPSFCAALKPRDTKGAHDADRTGSGRA